MTVWTWKRFKDAIEAQGVTDYTQIAEIRWTNSEDDPEVRIVTVRVQ